MSDQIFINVNPPSPDSIIIEQAGGFVLSVNNKTGIVVLTKNDLGLENVDNTSDIDKPLSNSSVSALLLKVDSTLLEKLSSNWEESYLNLTSNSANWVKSYNTTVLYENNSASYVSFENLYNNFLNLTGGYIKGELNVESKILSAGTDLFDIFLTSEVDNQNLIYSPSSYELSISKGNTVNLSSIFISPKIDATFQTVSALALSGIFYGDGSNLIGASLPGQLEINSFVQNNSTNWLKSFKILNNAETVLDARNYTTFLKSVTSSNNFTFFDFTPGKIIILYLSANHLDYVRHYFPQPTYLNKVGEGNIVFTFNNYITKIVIQNTGNAYIGSTEMILFNTQQVNAPLNSTLMLENFFGLLKQENDNYILL
jgi:hypothetical protein